ncbi:MAG TPA: DUF3035 domain-containing protein [Stellaceae bacterium]|nr:DUF3035 domain-containing protein [Stellaceae bacterium]
MKHSLFACTVLILAGIAATGCTDTRRALGLEKVQPDEFTVMSRAPLTIPPDFTLRPPDSNAPHAPGAISATEQARQTVFRAPAQTDTTTDVTNNPNLSSGERALLAQAGATTVDPKIRQLVNQENSKMLESDHGFIDSLAFWQATPEPGTVVDATKEAQRLRENSALGKSVTNGDTPSIERTKRSILDGIF